MQDFLLSSSTEKGIKIYNATCYAAFRVDLLLQTPRAMQEMIEERSVEARLRYCIEHLQERLLSRAPGGKAN